MSAAAFAASAWAGLVAWSRQTPTRQPLRTGLLNTGELVLIDGAGNAQVLSAATTALVRDVLFDTDLQASELVMFPQAGKACDGGCSHARQP